jgi:hypothetical protein
MMPSVGDGSVPLHHHDPAIRLSAAGFGGLFALWLWPRLDPPGNDSNAPFASERQSFLRKRAKILTTPRTHSYFGKAGLKWGGHLPKRSDRVMGC